MKLDNISLPHRSEDVSVEINDQSYELGYYEFCEKLEGVTDDSDISYSIWFGDKVLSVEFYYKNGEVVNYREEVID